MAFGNRNFKVVNVYFGALVTPKNDMGLEILRKHLWSSHLARQTKLTIYKTLILE
jgi:hypothetical protein